VPDDVDGRVENCTRCIRHNCVEERSQCLASERCRDMLRCMGPTETNAGCDNPNCIARCVSDNAVSPYFWKYFACAFTSGEFPTPPPSNSCATECGAGANWDCVHGFDWDPMPTPSVDVAVQIYIVPAALNAPLLVAQFVEIAACTDGYPDPNPVPGDVNCREWTPLSAYGEADLEVPFASPAFAFRSMKDESGSILQPWAYFQRLYPRPLRRSGPFFLPVVLGSSLAFVAGSIDGYEPGSSIVFVNQVDCLGTAAAVKVELPDAPSALRTTVLNGESHPELEYFTNAFFVKVPPALTRVRSSLRNGTVVSARAVVAAPGWFTTVTLYPATRQE